MTPLRSSGSRRAVDAATAYIPTWNLVTCLSLLSEKGAPSTPIHDTWQIFKIPQLAQTSGVSGPICPPEPHSGLLSHRAAWDYIIHFPTGFYWLCSCQIIRSATGLVSFPSHACAGSIAWFCACCVTYRIAAPARGPVALLYASPLRCDLLLLRFMLSCAYLLNLFISITVCLLPKASVALYPSKPT
jgi:hypothetical protein